MRSSLDGISWDRPLDEPGRFAALDRFGWVKSLRCAPARQFPLVLRELPQSGLRRLQLPELVSDIATHPGERPNLGNSQLFRPFRMHQGLSRNWPTARRTASASSLRRLEIYRGTRLMGEVASRLLREFPQVQFTFAGDGPDRAWLVDRFSGEPRVHLCTVPYEQRMALTLEHDIAVVPTLGSEGTSLSLAEAMISGCTVVATDVGGMTNMIFDGYNGRLVGRCQMPFTKRSGSWLLTWRCEGPWRGAPGKWPFIRSPSQSGRSGGKPCLPNWPHNRWQARPPLNRMAH